MTWTCEQIEARLSEYIDGALAPAEMQSFAAHAQQCPQCAPLLAGVSGLVHDLRALPPIPEPPRLVYVIIDNTLGPRRAAKGWRAAFGWLAALATPRFAYGSASVAATCVLLLTVFGFNWKHPRLGDLYPANIYRAADSRAHRVYARGFKFVSDLRVVYEIQSRLRPDSDLRTVPEGTVPESSPKKQPGMTNGPKSNGPRQQNRANGIRPEMTVLAATFSALSDRSVR